MEGGCWYGVDGKDILVIDQECLFSDYSKTYDFYDGTI